MNKSIFKIVIAICLLSFSILSFAYDVASTFGTWTSARWHDDDSVSNSGTAICDSPGDCFVSYPDMKSCIAGEMDYLYSGYASETTVTSSIQEINCDMRSACVVSVDIKFNGFHSDDNIMPLGICNLNCPSHSTAKTDGTTYATCSCNSGYTDDGHGACVPQQQPTCKADQDATVALSSSARIRPPPQQLGTYVVTSGTGLNPGACTYRSGGPLVVQVPVPPMVNSKEIGPDGHLINPSKLITNNVIGATAIIQFPAYDVDNKTPPPASCPQAVPEQDTVTFNGKFYAPMTLSGTNNQWRLQQITVPISELKFGAFNNELSISIDVGNTSVATFGVRRSTG